MNRSTYTKCSLCGKISVHSYVRNNVSVKTCLSKGCAYFVTEPVKTKGKRNGVR